ncbi:MAG: hypothetical protein RIC87_01895 [Kiloniellales bacterium]
MQQSPEAAIQAFATHYDYDASYMEQMLRVSPAGFEKFQAISALSQHCEAAPVPAAFAARLVGVLTEDCGPCVQLVVRMAREAGMAADQITAVLRADESAMSKETALGYRFATAVVARNDARDLARAAIVSAWGEKAVIDLTFSLQVVRVFPMVKAGLGYDKTCQRVEVEGQTIEVVHQAVQAAA